MLFSKQEKTIVFNVIRQFIYFCVVFAFVLFLVYLSSIYHSKTFAEHGVVENIQLGLLLSSGLIFLVQLKLRPEYACVLWLLASCSFLAACRELDMFFDEHLPVISWRIGFIFPLIAFGKAYQYSYCLKKTLIRFFTSPSFYMMSCSMIIIIPVKRDIVLKSMAASACSKVIFFIINKKDANKIVITARFNFSVNRSI